MSNSFYCNLKYQEYKNSKKNKTDQKSSADQVSDQEKGGLILKKADMTSNHKIRFRFFKIFRKCMEKNLNDKS